MRVLVVEDEHKVASFIKRGLEELHYDVDVAYDGFTGEKLAASRSYDVVLLDIIIPVMNGIDLCKKLKKKKPETPILMLTALGTTEDKVTGFEAGADDYLLKPFEFAELIARVKALTRRSKTLHVDGSAILRYADLELDTQRKTVVRGGRLINLTAKEFALLTYFMQNRERVISRAELAEKIWDVTFDTGTNVVEVYINILRKKIGDHQHKLLHTRVGFGYILSEEK
jgi:DNA-binding response OmpR family regulator